MHCKNISRIYGKLHIAGNQLPGHEPLFFTGTCEKLSRMAGQERVR